MKEKQIDIFLAAYFSDFEKLRKTIEDKNDLILPLELHFYTIPFTVFDILQMNLDIWEDCKEQKKIENYPDINPNQIYEDALLCINYLSNKFQIDELDCEHYLKIADQQTEYDDCLYFAYLYEDEVKEYLAKGLRQIDIDLANFTYRGNVNKVLELLELGANPEFDPDEENSTIISTLATEAAWAGLQHIGYLLEDYKNISKDDWEDMVHILYSAALSEKMYKVINDFVKQSKTK